jgi:hypothetical protein
MNNKLEGIYETQIITNGVVNLFFGARNFNCNFCSNTVFSMVNFIINLLHKLFSKNKHFGNIRTKHEMSAPLEWRETIWDKIKKDKLFNPIDINSKEHFKEIRIKYGKKFIIVAVNIFLISFSFNIAKDTYNLIKADLNLLYVNNINFSENIPSNFILDEQNKIKSLEIYIKKKDKINIIKTTAELSIYAKWKDYFIKDKKQKFIEDNENKIKENILSFVSNLFVLYLIFKKKIIRQQ